MITVQVKTPAPKEKHIPAIYRLRNSNVRALFFEKALGLILVDNDSKSRVGKIEALIPYDEETWELDDEFEAVIKNS